MLWKARTSLDDRPGTLARLATECGDSGVNILALQVFPGVGAVTDELVLEAPDDWTQVELAELVERAGASLLGAHPCGEGALADQPARYVGAARTILAQPARFPEVVARLFDADPEPLVGASGGTSGDTMDMVVGDVAVQVHRAASFTATEHARGAALAELVTDVLSRSRSWAEAGPPGRRLGTGSTPEYVAASHAVTAVVDGTAVGRAVLAEVSGPGMRRLVLEVDPAWRRRGIGVRLLLEAARLARSLGDDEAVMVTSADNQAVLPMVLGSGLRGLIRLSGDELTVRVPLRDLARTRSGAEG